MRSFLFNVHVVTSFTIELSSCNQSYFNSTHIRSILLKWFRYVTCLNTCNYSSVRRHFCYKAQFHGVKKFVHQTFFPSFPKSRLESWFTRIFNICRIVLKLPRWLLHSKKLRTRIPIEIQQSLRNKILTLLLVNPIWYSM